MEGQLHLLPAPPVLPHLPVDQQQWEESNQPAEEVEPQCVLLNSQELSTDDSTCWMVAKNILAISRPGSQ